MNQPWGHAIMRNMRTARVYTEPVPHQYLPWGSIRRRARWLEICFWTSLLMLSFYLLS